MLMRSDPFRNLDRLAQELLNTGAAPASMPMDAYREGDQLVVNFDLPGVDPDAIDVTVERNVVSVSAQRATTVPQGAQVFANERPQGDLSRQLILGENLDTNRLEAQHRDGVLTLTIPVAEQAKPRKLGVQTANREPIDVRSTESERGEGPNGDAQAS
jgi:HSP20 family protein